MSSYSELCNQLEGAWLVLVAAGRGRVSLRLRSLFPHLSLWAPPINDSPPRPPEGAEEFPRTSWALPFGVFLSINDFGFCLKRFFLGCVSTPGGEGSSCQLTSLLLPRNPPGAQQLLHPSQDQFCRDNWWLLHQVFLLSVNTLPPSRH